MGRVSGRTALCVIASIPFSIYVRGFGSYKETYGSLGAGRNFLDVPMGRRGAHGVDAAGHKGCDRLAGPSGARAE